MCSRQSNIWINEDLLCTFHRIRNNKNNLIKTVYDYPKNPENKCCEDVEKLECLCTAGGNVKWCRHCGKQYRGSSENKK